MAEPVRADIKVREFSSIVEVRIEHPVNDRGFCMNVSSGAVECRGAEIGLLVEVHAAPARLQPLRLNPKDNPVGRSRHCDLADHLAVSTFETAGTGFWIWLSGSESCLQYERKAIVSDLCNIRTS